MKTWNIYGEVAATKYLGQVEAETREEAIEKGWKLDECYVSVCHQCAREVSDPEINELSAEERDWDEQ